MTTTASTSLGFDLSPDATNGQRLGLTSGVILVGGTWLKVNNQVVQLVPSATNFVEVNAQGVASANTTGFTAGRNFLYVVVTGATAITSIQDWRFSPADGWPSTQSASASGGIGYATGAGGLVTQITNRSTGVTMVPNPCMSGTITTDTTSLAAEAAATFIVTNSGVAIGDTVIASIQSGSNGGNTAVTVTTVTNGTFSLTV